MLMKFSLTLTGLTLARYGQIALRLPEVILEANNQNRYCSRHQYLPQGPLTNFLSCLVLSPGVARVVQVDESLTKMVMRLPAAILVTSNQNRYCS